MSKRSPVRWRKLVDESGDGVREISERKRQISRSSPARLFLYSPPFLNPNSYFPLQWLPHHHPSLSSLQAAPALALRLPNYSPRLATVLSSTTVPTNHVPQTSSPPSPPFPPLLLTPQTPQKSSLSARTSQAAPKLSHSWRNQSRQWAV